MRDDLRRGFSRGPIAAVLLSLAGFSSTAGLSGCGGSSQQTGEQVKQDQEVVKRNEDMAEFYKKNPLSNNATDNDSAKAAGNMSDFYKKNPPGGKAK